MTEECRAADLLAGTLCAGTQAREGLGLRIDCQIPFAGIIRLVHWLIAPYADTPSAGIVEDAGAMRMYRVTPAGILRELIAVPLETALPASRADRRNLLSGDDRYLLGLRGWDIPHDRHMVLTDTENWTADITGSTIPRQWRRLAAIRSDRGITMLEDQERPSPDPVHTRRRPPLRG